MSDEIEVCQLLTKKIKQFNTITNIVETGLDASTVITGEDFPVAFAGGAGLLAGIALSETIQLFSLAADITQVSFKILTVKQNNTMQLSCLLNAS